MIFTTFFQRVGNKRCRIGFAGVIAPLSSGKQPAFISRYQNRRRTFATGKAARRHKRGWKIAYCAETLRRKLNNQPRLQAPA
jgi:hypothetical protein